MWDEEEHESVDHLSGGPANSPGVAGDSKSIATSLSAMAELGLCLDYYNSLRASGSVTVTSEWILFSLSTPYPVQAILSPRASECLQPLA